MSQDFELMTSRDTLTIRATSITSNPLNFGDHSLETLKKLNPKTDTETVKNMHVENKIDTIFNLALGADKFKVYKWEKETNILIDADLLTPRFKTRHGIRIGMKKQEIIKLLSSYKLKTIPKYLVFENLEVPEFLIFIFNNDTLTKIVFDGYID